MIENKISQEKLLTMLTEIYDQLEELEEVLEYSLADLRSDISKHHTTNLSICEDKLTNLEHFVREQVGVNENCKDSHQSIPQTLKLELGF